jgi:metal-responsive CopG/Arc/MetJ family transcriptional regulator
MVATMKRPKKAEVSKYGETKNRYNFTLTETTSDELDNLSFELGVSRSELIEIILRCGGLELARKAVKKAEKDK